MFCEKCGNKLDRGDRFCPVCGNPVDEAEDSLSNNDVTAGMGYGFRQPATEKRTTEYETGRRKKESGKKNLDAEWEKEERREKITFLILGVIIICLVIAIVAGIIFLIKSGNEENDGDRVPQLNEQLKEELDEKQKRQEVVEEGVQESENADGGEMLPDQASDVETEEAQETVKEVTPVPTQELTPTPTQETPAQETPVNIADEYIIPDSSTRYLSNADLNPLTEWEIRVARNEIYARHGRMFKSQELTDYFKSKSWYVPSIPPEQFDNSYLNTFEIENLKFITNYEKAHNLNQ